MGFFKFLSKQTSPEEKKPDPTDFPNSIDDIGPFVSNIFEKTPVFTVRSQNLEAERELLLALLYFILEYLPTSDWCPLSVSKLLSMLRCPRSAFWNNAYLTPLDLIFEEVYTGVRRKQKGTFVQFVPSNFTRRSDSLRPSETLDEFNGLGFNETNDESLAHYLAFKKLTGTNKAEFEIRDNLGFRLDAALPNQSDYLRAIRERSAFFDMKQYKELVFEKNSLTSIQSICDELGFESVDQDCPVDW